mgnify:CR=1 FL=1
MPFKSEKTGKVRALEKLFYLFIATHMMYERMAPEAPMRDPTTVIKLLFSIKPSAHSAQPE